MRKTRNDRVWRGDLLFGRDACLRQFERLVDGSMLILDLGRNEEDLLKRVQRAIRTIV